MLDLKVPVFITIYISIVQVYVKTCEEVHD